MGLKENIYQAFTKSGGEFELKEDFGKLRFDKINNQYGIKDLLSVAVDSLIICCASPIFPSSL